jgi:hypothetical protein
MKFIVLIALFIATPATAQIRVDDGIRSPQSMMVSGESVIDDGPIDDQIVQGIDEENSEEFQEQMKDVEIIAPIEPTSPSAPAIKQPKVKQVIKPMSEMKIRRSIADDRIDDGYVQEMVKDNYLFTPDYKDNR